VGSSILQALVRAGGAKNLKIADHDNLETTNLNRIQASLLGLGKNKTEIAAQSVFELDPFANLSIFPKGLNGANLKKFLLTKPKLDVFIDSMDSFPMKIRARQLCKKFKSL